MSKQELKNSGRINQISLLIVVINCTVGLFVYFFLAHSLLLLAGILTESLLAFVPIYLNRRGQPRRAAFVLYFILAAASFFFSSMIGNASIANLMGVVLVASGGLFFSDRKSRIWSYLIAIFVVWGVQENHVIGLIPEIKLEQLNYSRLLLTAYIVVVFLVFTMVGLYRRAIGNPEKAQGNEFFSMASIQKWTNNGLQADRYDLSLTAEYGLIDIRSLFKEVEADLRPLARAKKVRLVCNVSVGFPKKIQSDERILRSIVTRLTKNAIQSSPSSTTIRIGAYVTEHQLNIMIEDHGLGSAPSMKIRLLEPGTGLYVTRKLVLKLGGTFEIVDKGADGAVFIITWVPPKEC